MRRGRGFGLALAAVIGLGACASGSSGETLAAPAVARIHLRNLGQRDLTPPTQLNVLIGRRDAPDRWRAAWGGDGSLAWAERKFDHIGCGRVEWHNGSWAEGVDCDY